MSTTVSTVCNVLKQNPAELLPGSGTGSEIPSFRRRSSDGARLTEDHGADHCPLVLQARGVPETMIA